METLRAKCGKITKTKPKEDFQNKLKFQQKKDKNFINLNKVRLILHGISQQGGCLKEKTHRRYISEELISTIIDQTPVNKTPPQKKFQKSKFLIGSQTGIH